LSKPVAHSGRQTTPDLLVFSPPATLLCLPHRHSDFKFTISEFEAYEDRREEFFKKPRARVALLAGGIVWRLALEELGIQPALSGPTDSRFYSFEVTTDSGEKFVDDALSVAEMDLICGVYYVYGTGTKLG
jgi:hypothetical protein